MQNYYAKYLKYKNKYLSLKNMRGGGCTEDEVKAIMNNSNFDISKKVQEIMNLNCPIFELDTVLFNISKQENIDLKTFFAVSNEIISKRKNLPNSHETQKLQKEQELQRLQELQEAQGVSVNTYNNIEPEKPKLYFTASGEYIINKSDSDFLYDVKIYHNYKPICTIGFSASYKEEDKSTIFWEDRINDKYYEYENEIRESAKKNATVNNVLTRIRKNYN